VQVLAISLINVVRITRKPKTLFAIEVCYRSQFLLALKEIAMSTRRVVKYWRNSLANARLNEVTTDNSIYLEVPNTGLSLIDGFVHPDFAISLFSALEKKREKEFSEKGNAPVLETIPILISPFHITPIPESQKAKHELKKSFPFFIKSTLKRTGELGLQEDTFPHIVRSFLEPQSIQQDYIFSSVDEVDKALSRHLQVRNWGTYWKYVVAIFEELAGCSIENYQARDFATNHSAFIFVNELFQGATDGIIALYDQIQSADVSLRLLDSLTQIPARLPDKLLRIEGYADDSLMHRGQMGFEFPLSNSQRKSIYHYCHMQEGEILGINGPPGTGKTTFLQSIVASEVVASALEGNRPKIILACSANNQAVTNIIDSFANVKARDGVFFKRWIPYLSSFALYLTKKDFIKNGKEHYYKLDSESDLDVNSVGFINTAKSNYLHSFKSCFGEESASVEASTSFLRNRIIQINSELAEGVRIWNKYKARVILIESLRLVSGAVPSDERNLNDGVFSQIENSIKIVEKNVGSFLDAESIWLKVFSFLKPIKEKRAFQLKRIFGDCMCETTGVDFFNLSSITDFFEEKFEVLNKIKSVSSAWIAWKSRNQILGDPPLSAAELSVVERKKQPYFYDELEVTVKNELFFLAVHYWEGRWILEADEIVKQPEQLKKRGKQDVIKKWERLAMLTPCFVSTFFMAPKFFTASKFLKSEGGENIFEKSPLYNFIDLLIVDEAGQVSPEVGGAMFALAKKAVVVGDTQQLEPIWGVPEKVDFANLLKYQFISSLDDGNIAELSEGGFLSSSGNLMKLAQKSSKFSHSAKSSKGMLLTEHRRCHDEIIAYCNDLAYDGLLEPKKGRENKGPLKPMDFVEVLGESISVNSSRINKREAFLIAKWIAEHKEMLLKHYQTSEDIEAKKMFRPAKRLSLADLIAVITPFAAQNGCILEELRHHNIDVTRLTVGTVHSLQGAERAIILFSSVYGTDDLGKRFFFDSGVNMLNVAVSRAKDSFIMFGYSGLFKDGPGSSPSKMLYHHINRVSESV